jgi:uncharacterized protein YjbJ (UPF0337 family)
VKRSIVIAAKALSQQENTMSIPNKDEIKGKFDQAKGEVKEKFGRATNDPELVQESQDDKASGRTQETFGKARRKVGDIVKDIGDSIAR